MPSKYARSHPFAEAAKDRFLGQLGTGFKLLQPTHEGPQDHEPTSPGVGVLALTPIQPCLGGHDLERDRLVPLESVDVASEVA